uniref:DNA polymerase delta subunit 3-like n=1 Tax=Styela clava TaxID=7725 RepID=UPI00193AB982|nr:DNA polymerase delta subunit 3-like [Styela clava]
MDELDSFLATVDEFVDDENRIVTYKWLSEQLAIPTNKAKSLLQNYADSCKKQNNGIHIVYAIIGHDSAGMSVKVVRDVDLDSAKSKMDKVYSVSLYSVQKMKLQHSAVLYSTDYDTHRKNLSGISKFGGITYNGAKCLSKNEVKQQKQTPGGAKEISADLQKQFAKPAFEKGKPVQQKVNFFTKTKTSPPQKKVKEEIASKSDAEPQKLNSNKKPDPPLEKGQKKGVAAFLTKNKTDPFAKSKTVKPVIKEEQKTVSDKSEKQPSKSDSTTEKSPQKDKTKESLKKEKKNKKSSSKRSVEEDDLRIDDFSDDEDDFIETDKKSVKSLKKVADKSTKPKTVEKPKPNKNKKNSRHDSNELPAKKRRRIQEMLSSSSEDENEDENYEEEMGIPPPSPPPVIEPEPVKEKFVEEVKTNKRREKVMKSRTFVDEEGCMVTQKYYEFEECDDAEPVANGNNDQAEQNHKNNTANGDTEAKTKKFPAISTAAQPKKQQKQASIMGFFKKK